VARWLLLLEVTLYAFVLLSAGARLANMRRDFSLLLGVPLAIGTMHICWGSAFLWSLVKR
jgi:hypothetical protein